MKERPILFSVPMVRAIFDGTKTQTRREVKPQPIFFTTPFPGGWQWEGGKREGALYKWQSESGFSKALARAANCPYGQPGDMLWVRQEHYRFGHWEPVPGLRTRGNRQKWKFVSDTDETLYEAPDQYRKGRHHKDPATPAWHKRLARFMPRRLSVIDLEIAGVHVERLQDISEADAIAEGIVSAGDGNGWQLANTKHYTGNPVNSYASLWESINGPGLWDANPWVWVIEFKSLKKGAA